MLAHRQCAARRVPPHAIRLPAFIAGPENRLVAGAIDRLDACRRRPTPTSLRKRIASCLSSCCSAPAAPARRTWLTASSATGKRQLRRREQLSYTTAADFRHLLTTPSSGKTNSSFAPNSAAVDLLAIDDLHQLPADDHVLQELRYTLDDYEDRGATVIVTSTRADQLAAEYPARYPQPPRRRLGAAAGAARRCGSRCRSSADARARLGRPLSDEVADRLAHGLDGTANNLFSAVFELLAARRTPSRRAMPTAPIDCWPPAPPPTHVREIIAVVARTPKCAAKAAKKQLAPPIDRLRPRPCRVPGPRTGRRQLRRNRPRPGRPRPHHDHPQLPQNRRATRDATRKPNKRSNSSVASCSAGEIRHV